jgi:hypothetical protein
VSLLAAPCQLITEESDSWIYRLILSEDANFKLKGRNRSSRENDPTLGPGWAYMVESTAYLNYLAKHVHEDEVGVRNQLSREHTDGC